MPQSPFLFRVKEPQGFKPTSLAAYFTILILDWIEVDLLLLSFLLAVMDLNGMDQGVCGF